jgi:hypothetical protein
MLFLSTQHGIGALGGEAHAHTHAAHLTLTAGLISMNNVQIRFRQRAGTR